MLSPFIVNDKNLFLDRFPPQQVNRSLQAWDSSDEYLINYLHEEDLLSSRKNILVFNDNFGAISLNLADHNVYCINDSYLSREGIKHNVEQNYIEFESLQLLSTLDDLPENIDLILYKIPKSKSLLTHQLIQIKNIYSNSVKFIAGDKAKDIHTSTLKQFEKYLGTTKTSLAVKKSRLVFCQLDNKDKLASPFPTIWTLPNTDLTIRNHANVYAREKLDLGARFFIQHLPEINTTQSIIDLGCGNGVIGLSLLNKQPDAHISFYDESSMAIASAKENVALNFATSIDNCLFTLNDCLTDVNSNSADLILCNPPFHQQNATTDHIAWQMFRDSFRVLKKGGELRIIGNRQLGYHIKLQRLFGHCKTIASDKKFVVLSATKK